MQNKRKERREATVWPGRIAFERGAQLRECIVRDISKDGARLTLANVHTLPSQFELLILTTGEIFQAAAKWRRGREVGVYFVEKDDFLTWGHGSGPAPAAG
jgi:hypothetical protein